MITQIGEIVDQVPGTAWQTITDYPTDGEAQIAETTYGARRLIGRRPRLHFRTLKYRPEFPDRFDSIEQACEFCRGFFDWYRHTHGHSGIGLMTPAAVHYARAPELHAGRARVLDAAYRRRPERCVRRPPVPPGLPTAAWINHPRRRKSPAQYDSKASHPA